VRGENRTCQAVGAAPNNGAALTPLGPSTLGLPTVALYIGWRLRHTNSAVTFTPQ
jgi:hypothetical protein